MKHQKLQARPAIRSDTSQFFYALTMDRLRLVAHLPAAEQIALIYFADRQRNPNRRGTPLSIERYALDCCRNQLSVEAFSHAVRGLEARGFLTRTAVEQYSRRILLTLSEESPFVIAPKPPFLRFTANERIWLLSKLLQDRRLRLRGCCLTVYFYLALRSRHPKLNLRGVMIREVLDELTLFDDGTRAPPPFSRNAFKKAVQRLKSCGLIKKTVRQGDGRIRYVVSTPTGDFLTWQDRKKHQGFVNDRFCGLFGTDGMPVPTAERPENRMFAHDAAKPFAPGVRARKLATSAAAKEVDREELRRVTSNDQERPWDPDGWDALGEST